MEHDQSHAPTQMPYQAANLAASDRFDAMTRLLATRQPRRHVIAGLVGGMVAVLGVSRQREGAASICTDGGAPCGSNGDCCSGICDPHLYRCLSQPTVCMAPSAPESVSVPQVEMAGPGQVQREPPRPASGSSSANVPCQSLPERPDLPLVSGPTGPQSEAGSPDPPGESAPAHQVVAWNY